MRVDVDQKRPLISQVHLGPGAVWVFPDPSSYCNDNGPDP